MKPLHASSFVILGALLLGAPVSAALAQAAAPSAADMEKALIPIPKALKGGEQGISAGAVVRFPSDRPTTEASVKMPAGSGSPGGMAAANSASGWPGSVPRCTPPVVAQGTLSLPQITFDFDSATLKPEARTVLQNLGTALNRGLANQKEFVLEGHTDSVGTAEYNAQLSLRRAEAAKTFLVDEMKVDPARLKAVGKGWDGLADPCHPRAADNRRIVVINPAQEG